MTNLHPDYLRIRAALPCDVDALAAIIHYAMPLDPQWDYRFPLRKQYPQDNYGYTRHMMKSFLEAQGIVVNVVTFPAPGLPAEDEVPAALAVWEVEPNTDKKYSLAPAGTSCASRSLPLPLPLHSDRCLLLFSSWRWKYAARRQL